MVRIKLEIICITYYLFSHIAWSAPFKQVMNEAKQKKLWHHSDWSLLLHYEKGIADSKYRTALNTQFYLSDSSQKNFLEIEFIKSLQFLFYSKDKLKNQCLYPARYKWMAQHLTTIKTIPNFSISKDCSLYQKLFRKLYPKKIYLVFSSSYLGHPGSLFGHTFIRISPKFKKNNSPLLDTIINFGAIPNTKNPLLLSIGGLIGLFPGSFSFGPYFYKIREYNDFESRDLWTYQINLNRQEKIRFIDYFIESRNLTFKYYFLSKNCSYQILKLLDYASENLDFQQKVLPWTVPAGSVQLLTKQKNKLLTLTNYRPGVLNRFKNSFFALNPVQQNNLKQLIKNKNNISRLTTPVLDAALEYLEYKDPNKSTSFKNKILIARSHKKDEEKRKISWSSQSYRPDLGHDSIKTSLGFGQKSSFFFEQRMAYHSDLDPTQGYPKDLQIELLSAKLSYNYYNKSSLQIQSLSLIHLQSTPNFMWPNYPLSWDFDIGQNTLFNGVKLYHPLYISSSIGSSHLLQKNQLKFTHFLTGKAHYSKSFGKLNIKSSLSYSHKFTLEHSSNFLSQINYSYQYWIMTKRLNQWSFSFISTYIYNDSLTFGLIYQFKKFEGTLLGPKISFYY